MGVGMRGPDIKADTLPGRVWQARNHAGGRLSYPVLRLPRFAGAFSCVPSMIDSLEVEVLYPA
jgi:hypothetical protein